MHIFKENFYDAWQFVPLLTIAAAFTCLNLYLNSVYMVYKRSTLSLLTMLAGAISNLFMNWVFIRVWGPVGATAASMLSLFLVFLLRVRSTHSLLYITIGVKHSEKGAYYANPVEKGHGGPAPAPAHPFVRPAFDVRKDEAYQIMKNILKDELLK